MDCFVPRNNVDIQRFASGLLSPVATLFIVHYSLFIE